MDREETLELMLASSVEAIGAAMKLLGHVDQEGETLIRMVAEVSDDLACRLRRRAHEAMRSLWEQ